MDIKEWLKNAFAASKPPDNSFTIKDVMDAGKIGETSARHRIKKKIADGEIKEIKCLQNGVIKKYYVVAENKKTIRKRK